MTRRNTKSDRPTDKRFVITTIVAILGFTLSLWNTWWQFSEHKRNEYEENAFRYRPDLDISQAGLLLSFRSDTTIVDTRGSIPTIVFRFRYDTARVRLYFTNKGNSDARLVGFGVADSASTTPVLRDGILNEDNTLEVLEWRTFYKEFSVRSGATDSIETNLIVTKNPGDKGIFHFALFYENQRRCLFDTYCWMPYRIDNPSLSQVQRHETSTGLSIRFSESMKKLSDQLVKIEGKRLDPKFCTHDEAERFFDRIASARWKGTGH